MSARKKQLLERAPELSAGRRSRDKKKEEAGELYEQIGRTMEVEWLKTATSGLGYALRRRFISRRVADAGDVAQNQWRVVRNIRKAQPLPS